MKLKRLIIQGFKSFKDKTTINFDDGITGVVGPNGCGKSNIVDALFWVMGEQSAKHLRGTSMKDVIFSGSQKYGPASWAEVKLIMENQAGKLIKIGDKSVTPTEIEISRKMYRDGESDFRINSTPCRLKDIQEIFMDTGAGAKSYSIIAQGEINKIVQAKPIDRKVMIEEVAGITKFKIRKKESLLKLEKTKNNLTRINDLKLEIEKNLNPLKDQAAKAKKARVLKERLDYLDLQLSGAKEKKILVDLNNQISEFTSNSEKAVELSTMIGQLNVVVEEKKIQKIELDDNLELLQNKYHEQAKKLAACEERYKSLEHELSFKNSEIVSISESLINLESEIHELSEKFSNLSEELSNLLEVEIEEPEDNTNELSDLIYNTFELENSVKDLSLIQSETEELRQENQNNLVKNKISLETVSNNINNSTSEIDRLESEYSGSSSNLDGVEKQIAQIQQTLQSKSETLKKSQEVLEEKESQRNQLLTNLQKLKNLCVNHEAKIDTLTEIIDKKETVKLGTKEFYEHQLNDKESSEYAFVGESIISQSEYSQAVSVLTKDIVNSIASVDGNNKNLFDWLNNNGEKSDGADFILSTEKLVSNETEIEIQNKLSRVFSSVKRLHEVVTLTNNTSNGHLSKVLNGYYIVDNNELSSFLSNDFEFFEDLMFNGIVTKNGKKAILKNSNTMRYYQADLDSEHSNILTRNSEKLDLQENLKKLDIEKEQLELSLDTFNIEINEIQKTLSAENSEKSSLEKELNEKSTWYEINKKNFKKNSEKIDSLNLRIKEYSKQKLELQEQELLLEKEREQLESKSNSDKLILQSLNQRVVEFKNKIEKIKADQLEAKYKKENLINSKNTLNERIAETKSQLEKYTSLKSENEVKKGDFLSSVESIKESLVSLKEERLELSSIVEIKEKEIKEFKADYSSLENELNSNVDKLNKSKSEYSKIEKKNAQLEIKTQQNLEEEKLNTQNVFDKYKVNLRGILLNQLKLSENFLGLLEIENLTEFDESLNEYVDLSELVELSKGDDQVDKQFELKDLSDDKVSKFKREFSQKNSELLQLGEINWQAVEDFNRQEKRHQFLVVQEKELLSSIENLIVAIKEVDLKTKTRFKEAYNEVNERFQKVFPIIFGGGAASLKLVKVENKKLNKLTGDQHDFEMEDGIDIVAQPPGKKMQNINLMSGGEKAMTAVSLIFSIFLVKPSPFCLLDEVDAPLDDANVGRFNELLREMSHESQFILITHNKKTMELNDTLYGITMQEPGISSAVSVELN